MGKEGGERECVGLCSQSVWPAKVLLTHSPYSALFLFAVFRLLLPLIASAGDGPEGEGQETDRPNVV